MPARPTPHPAERPGSRPGPASWVRPAVAVALLVDRVLLHRRHRDRAVQLAALHTEVLALRRLSEQLRADARTDPLTGLGNRRQWQEQLQRETERARRAGTGLAVAALDLDRFKAVNDTHGHAAGDVVLREVAAAFLRSVRAVDLVARTGGEEFAVALPGVTLTDAVDILERLRAGVAPAVTCSVGLSMWDGHEPVDAVERRADAALYRAKEGGRDRLVVA